MQSISATQARNNWSSIVDSVIREGPTIIKRTRDHMILSSIDVFESLLAPYSFTAAIYAEEDGTVTLSLNEIDLAVNGQTTDEAKDLLARAILEYADDYYSAFSLYSNSPNRRGHIPYVFKALITRNADGVKELIQCQTGKN